jgi:hypothetical protein
MPVIRLKSLRAWGSGLEAIEKLNCARCWTLVSAAIAILSGSNANADKLNAEIPNHCLTEPGFALDFISHDLCRTAADANDSQFQSLHGWRSVLPQQKVENIFIGGLIDRYRWQASSYRTALSVRAGLPATMSLAQRKIIRCPNT